MCQMQHITQKADLRCAMGLACSLRLRLALRRWVCLLHLRLGLGLVLILVRHLLAVLVSSHVDTRRETWWIKEPARHPI